MTSKDLDEAIEVASHIPCARTGAIEVRPIWGRSAPVSEYWCRSQNRPQQTSNPRVSSRPPTPSDRNRIETVDRIKQKDRSGHRRYSRRESTPPRRLRELESSRDDKHTTRNRRSCAFPSGTNPTGGHEHVCSTPQAGSHHAGGAMDRVWTQLQNALVFFPRERENHSYAHTEAGRDRWFRLVIRLSSNRRGLGSHRRRGS
jgi:hypothetical protein